MKRISILLFVAFAVFAVSAAETEETDLKAKLANMQKEYGLLQSKLQSRLQGWRRPDQFSMKELDAMLAKSGKLEVEMRDLFTHLNMRELEQGLANFRALLEQSYKDQGFEKDLPSVEAPIKPALEVPQLVAFVSDNWHAKDKDADTKKIINMEREYHLLLHDFDWLLRNSHRPIANLEGSLKSLTSQRDKLRGFLNSPVVGKTNFMETGAEESAEVETETETEAEAEADADAEEEASFIESHAKAFQVSGDLASDLAAFEPEPEFSFAEMQQATDLESELDLEAEEKDMEAEQDAMSRGFDSALDTNFDGHLASEAELQAEAEFGTEDSIKSLKAEADELARMEKLMKNSGIL